MTHFVDQIGGHGHHKSQSDNGQLSSEEPVVDREAARKAEKKKKRAFWDNIEKPDIQDQESTHRKIFFVVNIENY